MKKLLALLLALAMVFALCACGNKTSDAPKTDDTAPKADTTPVDDGGDDEVEPVEFIAYNPDIIGDPVTANLKGEGGGTVGYDVYKGTAGKDYTDPEVYTFNDYIADTSTLNWSPANWETSDDDAIGAYLQSGFYTFKLNSDLTGWAVTCELAEELPVDVTADYVGKYGIKEGDTAKAWKIKLVENAAFDDGTPINADTIIYSYKELLDPLMKNRRADSVYAGDFVIYNAKNYFYAGAAAFTTLLDSGYASADDAVAAGVAEENILIDCWNFWGAEGYTDAAGNECPQYVAINDETVYGEDVGDAFSGVALMEDYGPYLAEGGGYEAYIGTIEAGEACTWDDVGIFKTDEYEIVFVVTGSVDNPNYYVPYNLSSSYVLKPDLWESCKSYFNANGDPVDKNSKDIANITTNYCTTAETSCSYGPYTMESFEMDKQYTLVRNEYWYGYSDGRHEGQYQTDIINVQVINKHETALLAFLNGEINGVGLQSEDMEKYGSSDYIRFEPQSYTTKISFNTDPESCAERGTSIITNLKFREGFALAIDRNTFAKSYTSAGSAGYGMLNYMYVYDPFTGAAYRDTDAAKAALCKVYGLTYGDDGDFDDLEEAYDAITGYDMDLARECMAEAYAQCKSEGIYNDENVEIEFRVYQSDDIYVQMFNYLDSALKSACEGTGFEGKVSLKMTVDADYYETMYSGGTDMIFTTWGGAAYSPYTMLYECYCDAPDGSGNQMEYGFDTNNVNVAMEINGVDYMASLHDWAFWADNDDSGVVIKGADGSELEHFTAYDDASKAAIYANLEYAYLANYVTTPMYYRNVGSLVSQQGDYAVKSYIDLVGFGGIEFFTYDYTDAEWAEFAAAGLSY